MSVEIVQNTKVTIDGNEYICKKFPEIWKLLEDNNIGVSEENKGIILRMLFIEGEIDLTKYGANVQMEIV